MHLHAGANVWARRASGGGGAAAAEWVSATVVAVDEAGVAVQLEAGGPTETFALKDLSMRGDDEEVQDLIRLSHLNEPSVLSVLSRRYSSGDIYTSTGASIIIAINPFQPMPQLYGPAAMEAYRTHGSAGDDAAAAPRAPHIYGVASQAYWRMRQEGKGQALLVTGESGAGKTETSKLIMKYLAYLGGYKQSADGSPDRASVEQRVLESNPLLEAFGNAKTVRNDNSSRFGKYIELHFCAKGSISGARIHTYLLERSRLVAPSRGERNYHIFYQLLAGAAPDERARWRLGPGPGAHRLTSAAGCLLLPGVDDAAAFATTRHAMAAIGMGPEDQEAIFRLLAALLHLGDLAFASLPGDSDGCTLAKGSEAALKAAAEQLGCDGAALLKALTTRTRVTPDGPIVSPLPAKAAAETRDAFAKVVYVRLFDWLVARINEAVGEDLSRASTIGLLDIYGFESFEFNDLEQFCINLANEKLQQHFNHHVFKEEQAAYEREGIDWSYIDFVDNQDVLDLMEGKMGLMDLIDETCRFPTATPRDLADRLLSGAVPAASPRFSRAKKGGGAFVVSHYAGPVTYQTDHMLDKNRDFVISEHAALLSSSSLPLARALFPADPAPDAAAAAAAPAGPRAGGMRASASNANLKGFQFKSVGSQFKRQLGELAAKLVELQPHYVRCIKPNPKGQHMALDRGYALEQLKCGGVMEAVRIANAGYPLRRPFGEFLDTYWQLAPQLRAPRLARRAAAAAEAASDGSDLAVDAESDAADREAAAALLRGLVGREPRCDAVLREGADWQIGRSCVFMRAGAAGALSHLHALALNAAAARLQAGWRGAVARREAAARRGAALRLQAGARGMLARAEARRRREALAATRIQTAWRAAVARRALAEAVAAATALQAAVRGRAARAVAADLRRTRAAVVLQSAWRGRTARAAFAPVLRAHRAAVLIQRSWRAYALAHPRYTEAHHAAAAAIQSAWRNRDAIRSEVRVRRMQRAFEEYAARWRAALTLQTAWRTHRAMQIAHELREEIRRATFRRHAAMFQSMAANAKPLQIAHSVFRVRATAPVGPVRPNGWVGSPPGAGGMAGSPGADGSTSPTRRAYADVVKSDATASLESGERLQHRVGDLRATAKVTSLLGIWQQRLQQQTTRLRQQQQERQRQQLVWQRQQQLMRQHQRQLEQEVEMVALSGLSRGSPPYNAGPPILSRPSPTRVPAA